MTRTIVAVLRGGTSSEYNLSLKTGAAMIAALPEERYDVRDIFIDRTGLWHLRGMPTTPARALLQVDVALNALHGGVGEDGTVARLLERSGVPYPGSRPLPSSLALNKIRAREVLQDAGVAMPQAAVFNLDNPLTTADMARAVFSQFGPPYIVKPPAEGASTGIRFALSLRDLPDALGDVLDLFGAAIVEEFIRGREASVGVIERFRDQDLYVLPPSQVHIPEGARFVEHEAHAQGSLRYSVPSDFSFAEKDALIEAARIIHRALGLSHFSRMDFILAGASGAAKPHAYLLEVNTTPGLYPGSSFPPMLESVGSSVQQFLEHGIALAKNTK